MVRHTDGHKCFSWLCAALFVLLSWLDCSQRRALTPILVSLVLAFQCLRCASRAHTRSPNLRAKKKGLSRDASTQFIRPAKQPQLPLNHAILALAQEKHPDSKFTCGNKSGGLCVPLKTYPRTRWRVFQIPLAKETEHATGDRVCLSENCVSCTEHRTHSPSDHCRSFWIFFSATTRARHFQKNPAASPRFWDTCHTIARITLSITKLCHSTT